MKQTIQTSIRSVRLVKMVVDPLTGRKVLVQPLPFGEGTYLRLRLTDIPRSFRRVHRFLRAGTGTRRTGECKENREWVAYLAHKGSTDWPYRGMPLSTVISYLKWRGTPLP